MTKYTIRYNPPVAYISVGVKLEKGEVELYKVLQILVI